MKKSLYIFTFILCHFFSHAQFATFAPAQKLFSHPVEGLFDFAFLPVDYDKNGTMDYIGRANNEVVVYSEINGEYIPGDDISLDIYSRPYQVMDFNGDGWDDIIMEFFILEYDPIGEKYKQVLLDQEFRTILAVGDFNNDELNDVITSESYGSKQADVSVHFSSGGSFNKVTLVPGEEVGPLRVGDLEGDGDLDIAFVDRGEAASPGILINDGQGNFTKRSVQGNALLLQRVLEFDDIDNDGDMDLLIVDINEQLLIYENTDNYLTPPTKHLLDIARPLSNKIIDINNDGVKEVVSFNVSLNYFVINIYYSSGGLNYGNRQVVSTINAPTFFISLNPNYTQNVLSVYDAENDGDIDILLNFSTGDDPSVLLFENTLLNTSSSKDLEIVQLKMYPNPTSDYIYFSEASTFSESNKYLIFSLDGKIVKQGKMNQRVSVSDLASGSYRIAVLDDNKMYNATFMIQR